MACTTDTYGARRRTRPHSIQRLSSVQGRHGGCTCRFFESPFLEDIPRESPAALNSTRASTPAVHLKTVGEKCADHVFSNDRFVFASRAAVAGAVHDAEEGSPRADRIAILVGHYAGELMKVSQIVRGPSG